MRVRLVYIGLLMLLCLIPVGMQAQIRTVSGKVLNNATKKPITEGAVTIYAFNTQAAAEQALQAMTNGDGVILKENETAPERDGYYEIRVADQGAIIFRFEMADPHMEAVNGRNEINVLLDLGKMIEEVVVAADAIDINPTPKAPKMFGNKLILENTFPIPSRFGKPNGRLIIQPFVVECAQEDTIVYCRPMVFDGNEYNVTQDRMHDFNLANDPLFQYIDTLELTDKSMSIVWSDTVQVPDPNLNYHGSAIVQLEDYTTIYYSKDMLINTCEMKRPFRFLEYSFGHRDVNPEDYHEKPRSELHDTAGNIALTFSVGKAELDPENPENEIQTQKLQEDLLQIVNGDGSSLREFHITAVSSPEGRYASNLDLAKQRVKFANSKITEIIPAKKLAMVYQNPKAEVAGWDKVALALRDSLPELADEIDDIVQRYKDPDTQYRFIQQLPEYKTSIMSVLPALRSVQYEYKYEIRRALSPEEVMERYQTDQDYRSGKKKFALYEYWELFHLVKDPLELETLYRRAYNDSQESMGQPWVLAANNLAVSYLKRDTIDLTILRPLVSSMTKGTNIKRRSMAGYDEIINVEEVVANQLAMAIKANNYEEASIMAQILPNTPENQLMKAFAMCLGGYYEGGRNAEEREQNRKNFELVRDSSPINTVVMNLLKETRSYDKQAEEALKKLDKDTAIYWYLKAIIDNRKGEFSIEDTKNDLLEAWKRDEKMLKIAASDGEFPKDTFEYAEEEWNLLKEMENLNQ